VTSSDREAHGTRGDPTSGVFSIARPIATQMPHPKKPSWACATCPQGGYSSWWEESHDTYDIMTDYNYVVSDVGVGACFVS
jgi:hypothetical protein